eukprot:CAMPEP_0197939570 /NCGR_PEP_ID=MMETSP1439-20131203/119882_1 /TAXON_ID=66791 /ORGANISM="Gonyaulax spinifera, Strain CCMP409" /LENGTH=122 /DNA_ID=CAMNT_0043562699 /DNA_START=400 /DNA_END=764 /DNA_ORIENTATION=-
MIHKVDEGVAEATPTAVAGWHEDKIVEAMKAPEVQALRQVRLLEALRQVLHHDGCEPLRRTHGPPAARARGRAFGRGCLLSNVAVWRQRRAELAEGLSEAVVGASQREGAASILPPRLADLP